MKRIYYILNTFRTFPVWIMIKLMDLEAIIKEDMNGYFYLFDNKNLNDFMMFNRIISKKKLFCNIVNYRIKSKNKTASYIAKVFLHEKKDFEISQGVIGGG